MRTDQAYCVRCRKAVVPKSSKTVKKGPRKMLQGECPTCGTKVTRFLKA